MTDTGHRDRAPVLAAGVSMARGGVPGARRVLYTVFMVFPLFQSLWLSLFGSTGELVGLDNYATLLTDELGRPRFWGALGNNIVFFVIHMLVQNPVGLLLAAMLTTRCCAAGRPTGRSSSRRRSCRWSSSASSGSSS